MDDDYFLEDDTIAVAPFTTIKKGIFVAASAETNGKFDNNLINRAAWVTTIGVGTVDCEFIGTLTFEKMWGSTLCLCI